MLDTSTLPHRVALDGARNAPSAVLSHTDSGVPVYTYFITDVENTTITVFVTNKTGATVRVQQHCSPEHAAEGTCLPIVDAKPDIEVPLPLTFSIRDYDREFDIREVTHNSRECCYRPLYVLRFVSAGTRDAHLRALLQRLVEVIEDSSKYQSEKYFIGGQKKYMTADQNNPMPPTTNSGHQLNIRPKIRASKNVAVTT